MKDHEYSQLKVLENIYKEHQVKITISKDTFLGGKKEYPAVKITLGDKTFDLYVDDELDDIRFGIPLLNLCLVLRELEFYKYPDDYLHWCKETKFESGDIQVLNYYRSLGTTYREIEGIIGEINSQISDWDFEMNAGPGYYLRQKNKIDS